MADSNSSNIQQQSQATAEDGTTAHKDGRAVQFAEFGEFAVGAAELKEKLVQDSFLIQAADSFSCPPFIPMGNGSASAKASLNPFASSGSGVFSFTDGQLQSNSSSNLAVFHIGTAVAADPADSLQHQLLSNSLRKQQLLPAASMDGSDWGSGALLGPHMSSGIDSPTGSAVFKSNLFDAGSECGSLTGEGVTALEAMSTGTGTGKVGIGASRMGRQAAGASTLPFAGWGAPAAAPGVSISEITPADSDSDGERIECYRGDVAAGLHHSRLAAPNDVAVGAEVSRQLGFQQQEGLGFDKQELGFGEQQPGFGEDGLGLEQQQQALGFQAGFQEQGLGFGQQHSRLGFGVQQQNQLGFSNEELGFSELQGAAGVSRKAGPSMTAFAAPQAAAVAGTTDNGSRCSAATPKCSSSCSSSGGSTAAPLPPTYSETIRAGYSADDEHSSIGGPDLDSAARRVWPADYAQAAPAEAAVGSSNDGSTSSLVRHEAELAAGPSGRSSSRQLQQDDDTTLPAGSTGLVRRSRPVSRAPSQSLPAGPGGNTGVLYSTDGMVALPQATYNYEDDDHQPLVQHSKGMVGYAAGQVRAALHACIRAATPRMYFNTTPCMAIVWYASCSKANSCRQKEGCIWEWAEVYPCNHHRPANLDTPACMYTATACASAIVAIISCAAQTQHLPWKPVVATTAAHPTYCVSCLCLHRIRAGTPHPG